MYICGDCWNILLFVWVFVIAICPFIRLFKWTLNSFSFQWRCLWKNPGEQLYVPTCFQGAARLKLALKWAKTRCNLVVIWPFSLPWDWDGWGRVCQRIGTTPTWSRSLLSRGWGYDQRDSGALDFSEQTLRDAPGLLQHVQYPLPLPV